jgi:hypothetical protein
LGFVVVGIRIVAVGMGFVVEIKVVICIKTVVVVQAVVINMEIVVAQVFIFVTNCFNFMSFYLKVFILVVYCPFA